MPKADGPLFYPERHPGTPHSKATFLSVAAEIKECERQIVVNRDEWRRAQSRYYILVEKPDVDLDVLEHARVEAVTLYEVLLDLVKLKGDFTMQMRVLKMRRDQRIRDARAGRPPSPPHEDA